MSDATTAAADLGRPAEIQGLVDNIDGRRIFGWAWNPARPEERLTIELRLGTDVVATTRAEGERADLAGAGIGDGRHAFELPLTPEMIARRADLIFVARTEDGLEVPLPVMGARRPLAEVPAGGAAQRPGTVPAVRLSRSVEHLARMQMSLQQEVQSLSARLGEDAASGTATAELAARVETLELWCLRLDERLAALSGDGTKDAAPRRAIDGWQKALATIVILGGAAALILSWIGGAAILGPG